jgi:hypothetical protein
MLNFIKKSIEKNKIKRELYRINKELNEIDICSDVTRFHTLLKKKVDLELDLERI